MKTLPGIARFVTRISTLLLLLAAAAGSTGCLSKPALNKQTFAFSTPPATTTNRFNNHHILGIRKLQIASPFDGRSLVYRTGEFSYERDPYAEFVESPAEELMGPVRESLRRLDNFKDVVESGSALSPDTLVEIYINRMFGDFRQPDHPLAILTMQFTFFDARNGVSGTVIRRGEYSRSISLSAPSAAALMKGWDQALAEIFAEVSSDLRNSDTQKPGRPLD